VVQQITVSSILLCPTLAVVKHGVEFGVEFGVSFGVEFGVDFKFNIAHI